MEEKSEFLVNSYKVTVIEKIAKDNTTIFTDFDDFLNEAIGTYILFWTNPLESKKVFEGMLPHLRPEQIEFMKKMMNEKEFEDFTKNIDVKREKLKTLKFFPLDTTGSQRFHLDRPSIKAIEEIIATENVSEKLNSVKEFVEYAIEFFMTWWTRPEEAMELQYAVWPYIPSKVKNEWRDDPHFKKSFIDFDNAAKEWNLKQGNDLTDVTDEIKTKTVDYQIDKTIKRHEEFATEDEKPTMQTVSSEGYRSFIGLCKRMPEVQIQIATPETLYPEHRSGFSLPYDHYPLIWEFYTRMLPVKLLVAALADMMIEKGTNTVNYKEFRERGYYAALGLAERLSDYEKKWKKKRNEKRSTGFPAPPPIDTIKKIDIEKMKKFETSKQRFQEYFIGMKMESWAKRQAVSEYDKVDQGLAFFDGALNAMGLVNVYAKNNGEEPIRKDEKNEWIYSSNEKGDWSLEIGLTKRGVEFYQIANPIFIDYEQMWWSKVFSKKESKFILNEIIPDFPLENEFIKKIMDTLAKSKTDYVNANEIDEKIDQAALKWLQNNERHRSFNDINKCRSQEKNDKGEKIGPKIIGTWRARTMARLAEMNQIEWIIEKKTSKPQYKIKEEKSLKISKKKVAPTTKSK